MTKYTTKREKIASLIKTAISQLPEINETALIEEAWTRIGANPDQVKEFLDLLEANGRITREHGIVRKV